MSKLRSINTAIWNDVWFEELNPEQKLLFIYLITNEKTNMLGVYEISIRKISFDTGISSERVLKALKWFEKDNKIRYECDSIILLNYLKHQNYNFNMKKSAIDCYNNLKEPLKIENQSFIERTDKGFETLCKGFGMVRKIEVEIEEEYELEIEYEKENISEIKNFDAQENKKDIIINSIFDFWNSKEIIKHKKIDSSIKKSIETALKENTDNEIKEAIENYSKCLKDQNFYFEHNFALAIFLTKQRGKFCANYQRFLNDGDIWINYNTKPKEQKQPQDNYVKPKTDRIDLKKMNYDNVYEQIYGTKS